MLWPILKRESCDLFRLARVNDRVQLQVITKSYFTRIEDILSDEIHIAAPSDHGSIIMLEPGLEVMLNIIQPAGLKQYSCVVKTTQNGRVPTIALTRFRDLGLLQQRTYLRVENELPVRFRKYTGTDGKGIWRQGVTSDISGGGVQVVAERVWLICPGDLVELFLALPGDSSIRAIAQLVRIMPIKGSDTKYQMGLNFLEISDEDRSRLVEYVRLQRALTRKSRVSFVRCDDSVRVEYEVKGSNTSSGNRKQGQAYDMSSTGFKMTVANALGLAVGAKIDIELTLPDMSKINATCEVAWTGSVPKGRHGKLAIGVRFKVFHDGSDASLIRYLSEANNGNKCESRNAA